jgi:MarR family transcriptional regulator, organic hydroperoxide resistance regulator
MKQISEHTSFLLVQLSRAHRQRAETALNEIGLYTGQEVFLMHLWRQDGLTPSQLAEQLGVQPPTVAKMLGRIEKSGFIRREPDAEDARVSRIFLTEAGKKLEQPVLQIWQELEDRTLRGLSEVEIALLRRMLLQMQENLG